jgi:hypothetical protein
MKRLFTLSVLFLVIIMSQPARGSAPSPDDLENWKVHEQQVKASLEKAAPWKAALEKAFTGEASEIIGFVFLTTYKHHVSDTGTAKPGEKDSTAMDFFNTWRAVKKKSFKAKLNPIELAEAIYRFTNSDWAPVSLARGPGLDKVATPETYEIWADAAIASGKKALKAGLVPAATWSNQAASYQVREPGDIERTSLTAPRPRH